MSPATSSQYVASKDALLTLITASLVTNAATLTAAGIVDAAAEYAWPGPNAVPDLIFLGAHPDLVPNPLLASSPLDSEDPVMKAGRRQRQQDFDIEVTCWSFRPDLSPLDARSAEVGGQALFDIVDGVVADNVRLGLTTIQNAEMTSGNPALVPFQSGWASVFRPVIRVRSRLT